MTSQPAVKPKQPFFSSGPTVKYPGWSLSALENTLVGRSHRSVEGKDRLRQVIEQTRALLEIPADYLIAIIPGSATGAMEALLWSLLGPRAVDDIVTDVFSQLWQYDIINQLKLEDVRSFQATFGIMPELRNLNPEHDWVFAWNGTTGGLSFPDGDWIPATREGLTLCDATSAAFGCLLPWEKLDATAFSWQKGIGSEGGHGMIVLSPRAVARLESYSPPWPMPRLFRLIRDQKLISGIFVGETINTPSWLAVEDYLAALAWGSTIGLSGLIQRVEKNYASLSTWVNNTPWIEFAVQDPRYRSHLSPCLRVERDRDFLMKLAQKLGQELAGFDFINHKEAPPSLRIWIGPTVENTDLTCFLEWLTWGYSTI